jgi:hypothetical protein
MGGHNVSGNVDSIKESVFNCYYCDCFQTSNEKEYERHVVIRHPGKIAYPPKSRLRKTGIELSCGEMMDHSWLKVAVKHHKSALH